MFFFVAFLGSLGGVGLETGGQHKAEVVAEKMGYVGEQIQRCSDLLEGWIVMQSHPFQSLHTGQNQFPTGPSWARWGDNRITTIVCAISGQ